MADGNFEVNFNVPGISCGHCARTIQAALGEAAGVQQVAVDIGAKEVSVLFDSAVVTETKLKEVLAEADYPVAEAAPAVPPVELALSAAGASCGCCRI